MARIAPVAVASQFTSQPTRFVIKTTLKQCQSLMALRRCRIIGQSTRKIVTVSHKSVHLLGKYKLCVSPIL
jgi:hypothetical protein